MSNLVKLLNFTAHPQLEKSLGYKSNHPWVAFHWEPEIDQVMYNDGKNIGTGISVAWQIFIQHPLVNSEVKDYQLNETDKYWLILDRKNRNLYVGTAKIVSTMLEQPESLNLLACLDEKVDLASGSSQNFNYSQNKRLRINLFDQNIKYLIVITASVLIASITFGSWLLIRSKFQQQANQNELPRGVVDGFACGVGGSNNFSSFFNTSNGEKELHLVGVYEARSDHHGGYHPTGTINVKIERKNQPVILALSSYEPVHWNVSLGKEVKLEKVIINGYHDQEISGISGIPIEEFSYQGTGSYIGEFAYQWDKFHHHPSTASLVTKLEQITNTNLTSFQGCYRGTNFTIK
ncbi:MULTISPECIES: hypothetical protein [Okeania]|uniref:Uncharacterized protein n=1 Tax=Okeania hirsuta TaxID=1458930 RepID=A0A3N6PN22_9CYAN|nr:MULTISPECIES: hypothetical protein [Okeania]NES75587.1 hypothetical protein [Okeania sp. SIO1H4]NET18016.1 hypothetical protein [Okeania sp. SIO1H5]NET76127.1 hypothetical protein [Okeania sp. SIO1F9]NET93018.1 hypothetical protein [Okeania sp. SIO1H2]RQH16682.1 hypothetical protein D4Z78_19825 [Okeania hirsuta]